MMFEEFQEKDVKSGFHYFVMGWHLIQQKGIRRFVIMPILLNIVLMIGLFWLFISQVSGMIDWVMGFVPAWLDWLSTIMYVMSLGMILIFFYFSFTMLSGFIAAPFNGLLAEKVEKMLTGESLADVTMAEFLKDIPRMLRREWQKLLYSLPIYIAIFLFGFMPFFGQTVVPIIGFAFTAWMMAIQYCDYPFDNHKISFHTMRMKLKENRIQSLTFGGLISLCTLVPVINLVVIPVAVCGATAMWVETYRREMLSSGYSRQTNHRSNSSTAVQNYEKTQSNSTAVSAQNNHFPDTK